MQRAPGSRTPRPAPAGRVAEDAHAAWGWLPVEGLLSQHFDAGSRIALIGSPVLVVRGSLDTMVAPAPGRAMYERALPPKRFMLVEGAVHEDTDMVGHPLYRVALRNLFGVGQQP